MTQTKTPSKLEKILAAGHLAVTSECGPPRGSDAEVIKKKAQMIKDYVDAINITDNQTSVTRLCSLASVIHLRQMGLEPVLQMVVRHLLTFTISFVFQETISNLVIVPKVRMSLILIPCN
jgi:hypothetical protein